jgi:enoyl-CoA hydratase/carnithine racemase
MTASIKFADGFISAETVGQAGFLTIDRPERKNAINRAMWRAIPEAVDWLAGAGARAIILAGGGDSDFSAGADISEFDMVRKNAETARDYEMANCEAFAAIRTSSVPVIASIRGICFGGAFGLAAACDLRIAALDARFAVPAGRLGLAYPADAVADLVNALGAQRARHMLMTAAEMDGASALAAGFLLDAVVADDLPSKVEALAARITSAAPLSVNASRAAVAAALTRDPAALEAAARLGEATFESEDYAEGRAAFREKRKPVFNGR